MTSGGIENMADEVCGVITTEAAAAHPTIYNTITNIYLQVSYLLVYRSVQ